MPWSVVGYAVLLPGITSRVSIRYSGPYETEEEAHEKVNVTAENVDKENVHHLSMRYVVVESEEAFSYFGKL